MPWHFLMYRVAFRQRIANSTKLWRAIEVDSYGHLRSSVVRKEVLLRLCSLLLILEDSSAGPTYSPQKSSLSVSGMKQAVLQTFFPVGYPHSVTSNYAEYCKWQFIYLTSGTMTGLLNKRWFSHY